MTEPGAPVSDLDGSYQHLTFLLKRIKSYLCGFARAAKTKYHRLSGFNHRNLFPDSSGG